MSKRGFYITVSSFNEGGQVSRTTYFDTAHDAMCVAIRYAAGVVERVYVSDDLRTDIYLSSTGETLIVEKA